MKRGSLKAACRAIEADLESSKRYWTQVLNAARARVDDPGWSARVRENAAKEIARAEHALRELEAGRSVSIWGD